MNIDDAIKNATHESKCPFRTVGEQEEYKQIASCLIELKTHHAFGDYQNQAMKFAPQKCKEDFKNSMSLAGLGISGEAGEVTDYIKKVIHHGHSLNKEKLKEELGDVCWYIAFTCDLIGCRLEDVLRENIEKLSKRYPHRFNSEDSIHREKETIPANGDDNCKCNTNSFQADQKEIGALKQFLITLMTVAMENQDSETLNIVITIYSIIRDWARVQKGENNG